MTVSLKSDIGWEIDECQKRRGPLRGKQQEQLDKCLRIVKEQYRMGDRLMTKRRRGRFAENRQMDFTKQDLVKNIL